MAIQSSDVLIPLNAARAGAGLPPVALDQGLAAQAQAWATSLAFRGVLAHGDFADRIASVHPGVPDAEDVGEGQPDAAAIVAAWLGDPPHRAILLGNYDVVGLGVATDARGVPYWVADFALTKPLWTGGRHVPARDLIAGRWRRPGPRSG